MENMKRLCLTAATMVCAALVFAGCQSQSGGGSSAQTTQLTTNPDSLQSTNDSVSYVLGKNMHRNFERQGLAINKKLVAQALMDAIDGKDTLIKEERAKPLMQQFQQKMMKKRRQKMQEQRQQQRGGSQGQGSGGQNRKEQLKKRLKKKMEEQKQQSEDGGGSSQ
jgi:outer membrane murein-binding lipoprotein Lpp